MSADSQTMPVVVDPMPDWVPSSLYRLRVEEYEAMVASGTLKERRGIQLINGLLVKKMTQNPPHAIAYTLCGDQIGRFIPPGWHLRSALPIRLPSQSSEPEPDHCIVRGGIRDYLAGHPGPVQIAMVIEVSDSSLAEDRELGARVYGPAGIPVYWIVNLVDRQVEVHSNPGPSGYGSRRDHAAGDTIPLAIGGQIVGEIAVVDILP